MAMLRMSLRPHIALLHDVNHRLDTCPDHLPSVRQEMMTSRRVLYDVMEKQARQIHWIRAILFTAVSDVDVVICVYMHVWMHTCSDALCVCIYVYIRIYGYMYACLYVSVDICIYMQV